MKIFSGIEQVIQRKRKERETSVSQVEPGLIGRPLAESWELWLYLEMKRLVLMKLLQESKKFSWDF